MTGLALGDGARLVLDTAGQHALGWNVTTQHIEINGPVWVTSVVHNADVSAPLPPCGSGPNQWNFCSRVVYAAGLSSVDPGQHCAGYFQLTKHGTEQAELWGCCIEARDATGKSSATNGVLQSVEIDLFANGSDDLGAQIGRTMASFVLGQNDPAGAPVEATNGISFNVPAGHQASFRSPIAVGVPFSHAGLDFRDATPGPGAVLVRGHDDTPLSLDSAGSATVRWASRTHRFVFAVSGRDVASIDGSGTLRLSGAIQTGVTP